MTDDFIWEEKYEKETEEFSPPSYKMPGRILVEILGVNYEYNAFKYEVEVHEYDSNTSVFRINEGAGFEYWFDRYCDFPSVGWYVVEGIVGHYHRGTFGCDDDDEGWEYKSIRVATESEITTGTLDNGS